MLSKSTEKQVSRKAKSCSLNINTDRRIDGIIAKALPQYIFSQREPGIIEAVLKIEADIVCLFEVAPEMIEPLETGLAKHGYHSKHFFYNESAMAFSFLVISKNEENLCSITVHPLTKSGTYVSNSKRPQAPRSAEAPSEAFLAYKEEILGDAFERTVIRASIGEIDYYYVHLGLQNETRLLQTQKLREIVEIHSISQERKFTIGGDFNSFDARKTTPTLLAEQIEILSKMPKTTHNSEKILCTFRAFVFDLVFRMSTDDKETYFRLQKTGLVDEFREHCEKMAEKYGTEGTALDHVFSSESLNVEVEAIDLGSLSDHFMMVVTIQ